MNPETLKLWLSLAQIGQELARQSGNIPNQPQAGFVLLRRRDVPKMDLDALAGRTDAYLGQAEAGNIQQ